MSDFLADFCLLVTKEPAIIAIFLVGYFFGNRKIFLHALCLLLMTMIYNHWLKGLWKVPLNPVLGKQGWAFPSGHMHSTFVFVGFIAWNLRRKIMVLIPALILLLCVGLSLIVKGYHNLEDVSGACGFGSVSILLTSKAQDLSWARHKIWSIPLCLMLIGCFIQFILIPPSLHLTHLYLASGSLCGIFTGLFLRSRKFNETPTNSHPTWLNRFFSIIIIVAGLIFLSLLSTQLSHLVNPFILHFFTYYLLGLWIPMTGYFINETK